MGSNEVRASGDFFVYGPGSFREHASHVDLNVQIS